MNGNYYQNPTFPGNNKYMPPVENVTPMGNYETNNIDNEQSYIENILRLNKGKVVHAYVSFPDSTEWKNKIFTGILKEAGKDHLIIESSTEKKYYMILIIYLNYVEFDEPINYSHSYSEQTFS